MNLEGTNRNVEDKKTKKLMITIGIIIVILLFISIGLVVAISYLKSQQFKFNIDTKSAKMTSDLFIFDGDDVYVSIKDFSELVDYKYYNGGYKQYSEDSNSCYIEGTEEICTFEKDSNKIYKTPTGKVDYSFYNIQKPVKMENNKLYIISSGIEIACNVQFTYNKENKEIIVYTLPYLSEYYTKNYEYSSISDSFSNQKALLYNLLVVQNIKNTEETSETLEETNLRYGIITLEGKEVVGRKYTNIEFIESTKEFLVTTEEKKVGIISYDGSTKVKPQYDALKQIDKDLNLYLATSNNKKGVIEKNGKILIYLEYDEIGIDNEKFNSSNIKNPYVLFNKCIPVMQNNKWGMYDVKGNSVIPLEYDGIGCVSKKQNLNSVVIVPSVEGIVFAKDYELGEKKEEKQKVTLYGILSSEGKTLVPAGLTEVYYVVNNGREEYTMLSYPDNAEYDVIKYIEENN